MHHEQVGTDRRVGALRLLRTLREVDVRAGVRNSRIAFDVAMLFFEAAKAEPPAPPTPPPAATPEAPWVDA